VGRVEKTPCKTVVNWERVWLSVWHSSKDTVPCAQYSLDWNCSGCTGGAGGDDGSAGGGSAGGGVDGGGGGAGEQWQKRDIIEW